VNDEGSIESYWKVARRTLFEIKSTQTSNLAEAIVRMTHVLMLYANTTNKLVEADKWRTQGPRVELRPEIPQDQSTFDALRWEFVIDYPACGLALPITEVAKEPEEAVEKAFNKVYHLLKEQVKKRLEKIEALRAEVEDLEEETEQIDDTCSAMGVYAHRQLNLVTQTGNPF